MSTLLTSGRGIWGRTFRRDLAGEFRGRVLNMFLALLLVVRANCSASDRPGRSCQGESAMGMREVELSSETCWAKDPRGASAMLELQ